MRRIAIIAATAAMLLTSLPAEAQDRGRGHGRGDDRRGEQRYDRAAERRADPRGAARMPRYNPDPDARRREDPRNAAPPYGAAPQRSWRQGERLPPMYRGGYIRDPGRNRLRAAPPGYDWVGVGDDIYLVQRSTGMVLDSIPGGY